jgi:hypothetical protein
MKESVRNLRGRVSITREQDESGGGTSFLGKEPRVPPTLASSRGIPITTDFPLDLVT